MILEFGHLRLPLRSRHVIHTVGPIYSSTHAEQKAEQLESCYQISLQLAADNSLKHIVGLIPFNIHRRLSGICLTSPMQAFPSISTGIYGYPIKDATHIALDVVRRFLDTADGDKVSPLMQIYQR